MSKILPAVYRQIDIGALLDAFVRSRRCVPHDAHCIRSREELPLAFQSHTDEVDSTVWRAWSDGSRIWFVKAKQMSCKGAAGLQVRFFELDGRVDGSGVWIWLQDRPLPRASARSATELITTDSAELRRHRARPEGQRRGARTACSGG